MRSREREKRPLKTYDTLTDWARDAAQVVTVPIAQGLARVGFHPNTVTVLGFLLSVGVAIVLAVGRLRLGGWLLALVAPLDAVDGALARAVGQKSRFGAFLDSTLDRLCEVVLFVGLAIHYLVQGGRTEILLIILSLTGSMMVSYTRARAEGLGFACKVGVLTRLERAVVLGLGLVLGLPRVSLWILAVGANLTALHRLLYVYLQSRQEEGQA